MKARRIVVWGRVQGVGFRWSTMEAARRIGCEGWVRNRPDGTVEAHIQGPEPEVSAMERWLAAGPGGARVEGVRAADAEIDHGVSGFDIR